MTSTAELPPGPRWPAVLQSIAMLRFRHRFVPAMHRRYGDVFTVRVLPSGAALVLFTGPDSAKEIFTGDPAVFAAGEGNAILEPVMGDHSLLLQDGEEHRRARRLLMPAFNGASLHGYESVVTELARQEVGQWVLGRPFRSLERMNALTLEVILRVVFGVSDEDRLSRLRPLVRRTVDVSPVVVLGWGSPLLRRFDPWRAAAVNQRALDGVMYAEIRDRRGAPDVTARSDVLSRLLSAHLDAPADHPADHPADQDQGLSDAELRDQLVTLLLAGHETTATALSWALYELGSNADVRSSARAAAVDGDSAYLEAVLKESMRLHPVIPMVLRHLREPVRIAGIDLPRGVSVAPSILLGHQRAESHPEPERFDPRRFLDGRVAANTWIPFGGGVRRCIGAGFALMEGVAVLREVLTRYDVEVPSGASDEPKVRNITSVPRHGARIVVRPH